MFINRGSIRYIFLIPVLLLITVLLINVQTAEGSTYIDDEAYIYEIPISEETQRNIWTECKKNELSYELVLAIYQVEVIDNTQIEDIAAEIKDITDIRNYWEEQGIAEEMVFELTLLSRENGIESCKAFIKDNNYYDLDNYVKEVAEYKGHLEQSNDIPV